MPATTATIPATECLGYSSHAPEACSGRVEYRMSLSPTGMSYVRCDAHWTERLDTDARLRADYPDSSTPPAWFDPSAAGECWDEGY